MILTQGELVELTGRQRSQAQMKVLRFMGIEHRQRPDGRIIVLRAHVDRIFGATDVAQKKVHYDIDLRSVK
ncbi:MAG: DUF4224 domain-containing protein [Burkholderiales bacterium]